MTTSMLSLALAALTALGQTSTPGTEGSAPPEAAAPAPNSPEARAQQHFEESRQLFEARNYEQAIVQLQAAHKLVSSPSLLFNIARCYERMGDYSSAVVYYERYLADAVGAPDAEVVRGLIAHYREQLKKNAAPTTPEEQAAVLARKGREYYRAGRYADAIAQLERANRVAQKGAFTYNIAKCYEKQGDYDNAIVHYQRYIELEPDASDRQDVVALIAALQARMRQTLSELSVRTAPAAADIYIDEMGKLLGQSPLEIRLKPGTHKLVLVKNGYQTIEREFEMPEDRPRDLAYALEKVKNFGGLAIESNVNGAQVFLDGQIMGLTPYNVTKLVEQGKHQVSVQRQGFFLYQADVTIERGRLTRVNAYLRERGELTGWVSTLGTWVAGTSLVLGGLTTAVSYGLGGFTVQGSPYSEGFWTAQQVGMYGGLSGVVLGVGLIGLDLLIQPSDIYELREPSDDLPAELVNEAAVIEEVTP
ncbi:MAG: PEGA domain-containing protein [Pseudomonadota bacterium]